MHAARPLFFPTYSHFEQKNPESETMSYLNAPKLLANATDSTADAGHHLFRFGTWGRWISSVERAGAP